MQEGAATCYANQKKKEKKRREEMKMSAETKDGQAMNRSWTGTRQG
jgi:hypothetical protein